jgi:tRNA (guanine-N7-)-methyltransferase
MHDEWKFYGRRSGRKLNKVRKEIFESFLPRLRLSEDQITKDATLDPRSLFKSEADETILEIGFGNGERLANMIRRHPEHNYIGVEPFINGMTAFLKDISVHENLDNIRVHMDDAIPVVKSLTDNSIDRIYVLNPDPWHKTRHHQRRIINQDNLSLFSRILKPGAQLIMSTDVPNLIEWMVTEASMHPDFEWTATKADDWRIAREDWIPTRYETKGAKGADHMNYLFFKKAA